MLKPTQKVKYFSKIPIEPRVTHREPITKSCMFLLHTATYTNIVTLILQSRVLISVFEELSKWVEVLFSQWTQSFNVEQ